MHKKKKNYKKQIQLLEVEYGIIYVENLYKRIFIDNYLLDKSVFVAPVELYNTCLVYLIIYRNI